MSSVILNVFSTVGYRGFFACTMIASSRHLGVERFGSIGLVIATLNIFVVFAMGSLGLTLTRAVAEYKTSNQSKAIAVAITTYLTVFLVSAPLAGCCFFWSKSIAVNLLGMRSAATPLELGSLLIITNSINQMHQSMLLGLEEYLANTKFQVFGGILVCTLGLIGMAYAGPNGLVLGLIIASFFQCSFGIYVICNSARFARFPTPRISFQALALEMKEFGLAAGVSTFVVLPIEWCANVLLARGGGEEAVGLYIAAMQWVTPAMLIPAVVSQSLLPYIASKTHDKKNRKNDGKITALRKSILINGTLCGVWAVLVGVFAPFLLNINGEAFLAGVPALRLLLLAAVFQAMSAPLGIYLAGVGLIHKATVINVTWAVIYIGVLLVLHPTGAEIIAAVRLLAYLIIFMGYCMVVRNSLTTETK